MSDGALGDMGCKGGVLMFANNIINVYEIHENVISLLPIK